MVIIIQTQINYRTAAWYDLKVKIIKCKEEDLDNKIYPSFKTFKIILERI